MSQLLIISTQAPYYSSAAQDALEAALAASNVGIEVAFVFQDDGVFQLLDGQNNAEVNKKSIAKQIKALPIYDIEPIFYLKESAITRGLSSESLSNTAEEINELDFTLLCASSSSILRF
jgi:tRNA 2-thiouridine synthesizing protein C